MSDASERPRAEPSTASIRGLRVMAVVRWALLAVVAIVAAGTWWVLVVRSDDTVVGAPRFYCPMHPQIRSPTPGTCPICFMNLEPIPDERLKHAHPPASSSAERARPLASVMLNLERRQAIGVATVPVTRRLIARELRLPAVVEAPEKAVSEVRVRTPGFVERVAPVETGQTVKPGQALLWLYSPEVLRAEEELLAARRLRGPTPDAGIGSAGDDFGGRVEVAARERLRALGLSNADIDRVVDKGQAERLFPIHSGGGVVTARNVSVGTYAAPDMLLFQVTDLSRVWASASVPAEELSSVSVGTRGEFRSRGHQRAYEAEATLIEPRVSSDTRAVRVRFDVKNGEPRLLPGDSGEIVAKLPESQQTLVPRDAVVDVGNARYAFVEQSDGLFVPRVVELGPLIGEERVIVRGLEPGEHVVSRGLFLLDSESRLQASLAPAPPPASASSDSRAKAPPATPAKGTP